MGKFDPAARKFLGFRTVTVTEPCLANETICPSTETTYRQDVASSGLPEQVASKDSNGIVRREASP